MRKVFQLFRILYSHHIFAFAIAIVYIIMDQEQLCVIKISSELLSNSITILAIIIGFIGTIQTIILSLQNTRIIRNLKEQEYRKGHSYYKLYIGQLNATIWWAFVAIALSLTILVLNGQYSDEKSVHIAGELNFRKLVVCLWIYSLAADAASFYRSIVGMNSILNSRRNCE